MIFYFLSDIFRTGKKVAYTTIQNMIHQIKSKTGDQQKMTNSRNEVGASAYKHIKRDIIFWRSCAEPSLNWMGYLIFILPACPQCVSPSNAWPVKG